MIPEAALVKFLKDSAALNSSVGGRIFPVTASMTQRMPFIVYNRVASARPIHLLGDSGLLQMNLQLDVFARSYAESKSVAELIRKRVHGYIGTVTDGTETESCDMAIRAERDDYVPPTDASDTGVFRVSIDVDISISESLTANT